MRRPGLFSLLAALAAGCGNFGADGLAKAIAAATAGGGAPQLVISNIHFSATSAGDDQLEALFGEGTSGKPLKRYHVVTTAGGIKVGFLGVVGANAAYVAPRK